MEPKLQLSSQGGLDWGHWEREGQPEPCADPSDTIPGVTCGSSETPQSIQPAPLQHARGGSSALLLPLNLW